MLSVDPVGVGLGVGAIVNGILALATGALLMFGALRAGRGVLEARREALAILAALVVLAGGVLALGYSLQAGR